MNGFLHGREPFSFKKKINNKIELLFFFTTDQPMAGLVS